MDRIPEPELMEDEAQALAYAQADFAEPNAAFVDAVLSRFPELPADARVVDLGCGPADIPCRLAVRCGQWHIDGVDGSEAMLAPGRVAVEQAHLDARVRLHLGRLPEVSLAPGSYDAVVSNSLLHHLPDPAVLWQTVRTLGKPGAAVVVMDLFRPASPEAVDALVQDFDPSAPEVLVRDFRASLHAAFTPDEVRAQLAAAGLGALAVEQVSERHLMVAGRLPSG